MHTSEIVRKQQNRIKDFCHRLPELYGYSLEKEEAEDGYRAKLTERMMETARKRYQHTAAEVLLGHIKMGILLEQARQRPQQGENGNESLSV